MRGAKLCAEQSLTVASAISVRALTAALPFCPSLQEEVLFCFFLSARVAGTRCHWATERNLETGRETVHQEDAPKLSLPAMLSIALGCMMQ